VCVEKRGEERIIEGSSVENTGVNLQERYACCSTWARSPFRDPVSN